MLCKCMHICTYVYVCTCMPLYVAFTTIKLFMKIDMKINTLAEGFYPDKSAACTTVNNRRTKYVVYFLEDKHACLCKSMNKYVHFYMNMYVFTHYLYHIVLFLSCKHGKYFIRIEMSSFITACLCC